MTKGWGADEAPKKRTAPVKTTRVSKRTQEEADRMAPRDRQVIQRDGGILIVNNELGKYKARKRR